MLLLFKRVPAVYPDILSSLCQPSTVHDSLPLSSLLLPSSVCWPQVGTIIELLTARKGDLLEVDQVDQGCGAAVQDTGAAAEDSSPAGAGSGSSGSGSNRQRLVFEVPARGLIGFKSIFASITRGEGLMQRAFSRWVSVPARSS